MKPTAVPSRNWSNIARGSIERIAAYTSNSVRAQRLAVRNRLKDQYNRPVSEQTCENSQTGEEMEPTLNDIEAANILLSLMQADVQTEQHKQYVDIGVQVGTSHKVLLVDLITTDKVLCNLTGLRSMHLLDEIVWSVQLVYNDKRTHILSIKQRIILTFVKLKWNLSYAVLAVFFNITESGCQKYIIKMIQWLASVLKAAILFPSMDEIRRNMPICFEDFQDTQIVLDCTEIFITTPSCLCCRIRFYSHYKGALTVKFLTGVSPAGLITFVSDAYGGRASDKFIFEESNLISKLESGTAIMADKGFLIDNICMENDIKLYRPPFIRAKQQLKREESLLNKKIAAARVHVERCNARIKFFKILSGKLPFSLVKYVDEIFTIACAVTNLSAPILAKDKFLKT